MVVLPFNRSEGYYHRRGRTRVQDPRVLRGTRTRGTYSDTRSHGVTAGVGMWWPPVSTCVPSGRRRVRVCTVGNRGEGFTLRSEWE